MVREEEPLGLPGDERLALGEIHLHGERLVVIPESREQRLRHLEGRRAIARALGRFREREGDASDIEGGGHGGSLRGAGRHLLKPHGEVTQRGVAAILLPPGGYPRWGRTWLATPIALPRLPSRHFLLAYAVVPVLLGWFGYVIASGLDSVTPATIRMPTTTAYNPSMDDFAVFYGAGSLFRQHRTDVYELDAIHCRGGQGGVTGRERSTGPSLLLATDRGDPLRCAQHPARAGQRPSCGPPPASSPSR